MLMVVVHGPARELTKMVLGAGREGDAWLGLGLGLAIIATVVLIHAAATLASLRAPGLVHRCSRATRRPSPPRPATPPHARSRTTPSRRSPLTSASTATRPPRSIPKPATTTTSGSRRGGFADWRLEVVGAGRDALAACRSTTSARCADRNRPRCTTASRAGRRSAAGRASRWRRSSTDASSSPEARYLVFHSFQRHEQSGKPYYEVIDLETARQPQTILAYEMNGVPLPIPHGAPLRLRVENELGFKMVKYLRAIEVVADYRKIGEGMGGIREDEQQFDMSAHI